LAQSAAGPEEPGGREAVPVQRSSLQGQLQAQPEPAHSLWDMQDLVCPAPQQPQMVFGFWVRQMCGGEVPR